MRKKNIVKAAVIGAAVALVIPGTAYAATTATAYTPGSTAFNNQTAGALMKTSAQCGSNNASGGGVIVSDVNNDHVMETEPSPDGTNPATSTTTNPTWWLGYGGVGGQGGSFSVQPFVVCFSNASISGTTVAVTTVAGPSGTDVFKEATATCPTNTTLLGGGAKAELASNKSDKVVGDFPSDSSGNAAADGATNPTSWSAVALNGGMGSTGDQTTAFAICSSNTNTGRTVTVKHTHATGPNGPSNGTTVTSSTCGTSGNMISGGGSISGSDPTSGGYTAPGSQGDHMTKLYPSDSTGNANANNTSTTNWTARGHTGGMTSPTTFTDVWGLCMN